MREHTLGPPDAPVTLVEFADFQCRYSALARPILRELLAQRPATVALTFRHFPLTGVHPYADLAAEVAEAAAARGAFWPMHDWLFDHQAELTPRALLAGVEDLAGPVADIADFGAEIAAHLHLDHVHRDLITGVRSGVTGTPTFFVAGHRHTGGYSLDELLEAVDQAQRAAGPT